MLLYDYCVLFEILLHPFRTADRSCTAMLTRLVTYQSAIFPEREAHYKFLEINTE